MQINRSNSIPLIFPPTGSASGGAAPAAAPVPTPVKITPVVPQDSGVVYTASATGGSDFDQLSLQNQLEVGHDSGVFTKITMSKDGVLVFKPTAAPKAADFATAAAATMKDFEEGIAQMRKNTGEQQDKSVYSLGGKLKELTARLNVFA